MKAAVIQTLTNAKGTPVNQVARSLARVNNSIVNIRTANQKAGSKYWFDVTPSFYSSVHFFIFACGTPSTVYVFPTVDLKQLLVGASLGGQKQVPNFTIFSNTNELEPAGSGGIRKSIVQYLNAFALIP